MNLTNDERQFWIELRRKEHHNRAKNVRGAKRHVRRIHRSVRVDEPMASPAMNAINKADAALGKCSSELENLAARDCGDQFALDAGFFREPESDDATALEVDVGDSDDLFVTPSNAEETFNISRADLLAAAKRGEILVRAWKSGLYYYAPGLLSLVRANV